MKALLAVLALSIACGRSAEREVATTTEAPLEGAPARTRGEGRPMKPPPHPGVTMVDVFEKTSRHEPASARPEHMRYVYLKDGVEIEDPEEATEIVPIVEVRMLSLDGKGNLVSKEKATLLRIYERGPGGRPLRSTVMTKDREASE